MGFRFADNLCCLHRTNILNKLPYTAVAYKGEGRKIKIPGIYFLHRQKTIFKMSGSILFSLVELSEYLGTDPNAPLHNMHFLGISNIF